MGTGANSLRERWPGQIGPIARPYLLAYAYLPAGFTAFDRVGCFHRPSLARRVFGKEPVEDAVRQIRDVLAGWGYHRRYERELTTAVCHVLLLNRSPLLRDLSADVLTRLRTDPAMGPRLFLDLHGIHRAVAALGHAEPPPTPKTTAWQRIAGTAAAWAQWIERWHSTSTLEPATRNTYRTVLAKLGRWLAAEQPSHHRPGPVDPGDLRGLGRRGRPHARSATTSSAAAWLAGRQAPRKTVIAATKARLSASHAHLLPRLPGMGVDPPPVRPARGRWPPPQHRGTASARTPASSPTTSGPSCSGPGSTSTADRPARQHGRHLLPARADPRAHADLAVRRPTQRRDRPAARRLHPLAARRHARSPATPTRSSPSDAVCLLDVPTHKTGTAFTKPVDPLARPGHRGLAGRPARPSRRCSTARPASASTSCSPSARAGSPRTTSTTRSSRRSAARPASPPPTSAATSPATGPAPPSPASSTTPRSR